MIRFPWPFSSGGSSLPPAREIGPHSPANQETALVQSTRQPGLVASLTARWGGLWRPRSTSLPPFDFDPLMSEGTRRVETHDGSYLAYRLRRHPATNHPEVIFVGQLGIIAELVQRLTAANDGMNVSGLEDFLFPFNKAVESIDRWASSAERDGDNGRRGTSIIGFANAAVVRVRKVDPPGLYEAVYSFPPERFVPGIGHDHIPLMDPEKIPFIWQWVLARYLEDKTYERTISLMAKNPTAADLQRALQEILGRLDPKAAAGLLPSLRKKDALASPLRLLGEGVWNAQAGVRIDILGRVSALIVELYTDYPRGMWGPVHNLRKLSSAVFLTGRPAADGNIDWTAESYGPAEPNISAMLGHAIAEGLRTGAPEIKVDWKPPATHRPIPDPLDQFPRLPKDLSEIGDKPSIGMLIEKK